MDRKPEFTEGDNVRITKGTFASFFGTVVSVDHQNRRLTVLGRLKTEPDSDSHALNVSFFVVEKLGGAAQGTETILLVEDDEVVRKLVSEVLDNEGYRLLEAANDVAALSICAQYEERIHLLLTDVIMPEMSGRELADRLASQRPQMKVLYMSGYPDDVIVHHGVLDEGTAFIQKPFAADDLTRKVREVLDAAENAERREENPVEPIRVLLADDHKLVRAGIRSLLEKLPDVEVIAEASDGREAIRLVEKHEPQVVLTDIAMPALNGLEVTRHLADKFPKVRVVVLSMYSDEEHVYLALRAGAAGYLLKGAAREELELAIRAVAQGETYLSPAVAKITISEYSGRVNAEFCPLRKLSPRQKQVLQLIAEGKTTKQVALELNISVKTVEAHRMQLMDRLEIRDIAGLVRFAIKVGLVGLED
jgi:DNA-binding NarL/FixJ family response regulator